MRIHPLSASPATNAFFQTGANLPLTDDVTTIFVVGFPDDMTEREFQNMFTFCPGFEAASLKWHCKDQDDDNSVGSNGGKKQMIGFARFRTRLEAIEAVDVLSGKKVDQEKGAILKAEMAKKNLHIKRGSVAPINNTLLPTNALQQQQQQQQQPSSSIIASSSSTSSSILPFASSTTNTSSPSTATFVSGGNSSNATTTPTHTGTVNSVLPLNDSIGEGTMSLLSKKLGRHSTAATTGNTATTNLTATSTATNNNIPNRVYDAFSPLPSDLLSPADYKNDPFIMNDPFTCSTPTTPIFADALFGNLRSNSFDARHHDMGLMSPPRHFSISHNNNNSNNNNVNINNSLGMLNHHSHSHHQQNNNNSNNNNNLIMGPSPLSTTTTFATQHHQPFGDEDTFNYLSKSSPVSNDRLFSTSPVFEDILSSRMGSLTMQANNLTDLRSPSISSIYRPSNPADQNPPCNTLYVGNLPPNTNEDELRQLFNQCRGYKRMCFRNKPQGPMCFVEFDDVVLATQALNEHQGHCLTTSIKGGIRLSFSKNPLFIKGPATSTSSTINPLATTTPTPTTPTTSINNNSNITNTTTTNTMTNNNNTTNTAAINNI
ncbi:hypothetical protein BJ944DRAFT_230889 [Cunninghamella echinulata]|nr:hypothetical protein BJ944DRAFT_230889 [Cunninghamella echinulata]